MYYISKLLHSATIYYFSWHYPVYVSVPETVYSVWGSSSYQLLFQNQVLLKIRGSNGLMS